MKKTWIGKKIVLIQKNIAVFLLFLSCYRYRPVTIPLPFAGHRSSTFPNAIDRYSTFLNVIGRSLTLPQCDPLFPTNISLNKSLVGHVEETLRNVDSRSKTLMNDGLQTLTGR